MRLHIKNNDEEKIKVNKVQRTIKNNREKFIKEKKERARRCLIVEEAKSE